MTMLLEHGRGRGDPKIEVVWRGLNSWAMRIMTASLKGLACLQQWRPTVHTDIYPVWRDCL
jgi:hypothetical protein